MRQKLRHVLPDLAFISLLLVVPLIFFFPQTLGGKTLIPADNLFAFQPYKSLAGEYGIEQPHNPLLSDLILENTAWKQFFLRQVQAGELPLWQPDILAGAPFFAAGQNATLYPFTLLFLILPLPVAFGWFTVSQLWLAGATMYVLARVLGLRRPASLLSGLVYQLSGFYMVSVVFPMILAAAAWLPLELAMIELTLRQAPAFGGRPASIPWVAIGALGLGMASLAGHVEMLYFTLLVMAFYAAFRLVAIWLAQRREPGIMGQLLLRAAWLLVLVALGLALGAAQILPSYELASLSFREGAVSLDQVRGWAYPPRRVLAFLMPNFFGNPAHHSYFDLFRWQILPITTNAAGEAINNTHWGIKNYVEGGAYLGILPMVLALLALAHWIAARVVPPPDVGERRIVPDRHHGAETPARPYRLLFALLAILSLSFVFGTPTYALLYYGLPFINQSHSPFRWVWPLTLCVAALAGFGTDLLQELTQPAKGQGHGARRIFSTHYRLTSAIAWLCIGIGGGVLVVLVMSRIFFTPLEGTLQRIFESLALAPTAFPDGRAFYSYQARNALIFALMLLLAGAVLRIGQRDWRLKRLGWRPIWKPLAMLVVALDLGLASYGFHPAADPALLSVVPPSIEWLKSQPPLWRYIPYEVPGADTMNANIGWLHGLQEADGYDSLIPAQYADYMAVIQPQGDLPYNRIAPLYSTYPDALDSPLLDLLNVKYVVSEIEIDNPKYEQVYQDVALRIYENLGVMPRAFTLPLDSTIVYPEGEFAQAAATHDPRQHVLLPLAPDPLADRPDFPGTPGTPGPATITVYTPNEIWIDLQAEADSWLVLGDSYFPGWRAWVRPLGAGDDAEVEADLVLVDGNFRGLILDPGTWTIRMKYSPNAVKLGAFTSFMAGMLLIFALGVWLWRYIYRESDESSDARRIAKNSLTPIILNLFNKGILFAFAFIMLRILGPEESGKYQYAVVLWGWFEIISNFGLDTLVMREVARARQDANRYLVNTSIMRLALAILGIPLLMGFIALRQRFVQPPLAENTITAIWLLYAGLFFATMSKGLTALFYAYEKAEYPAALQTISAMLVAVLGVLALLAGFGIVGLAGVSIVVNIITLIILTVLALRLFFHPHLTFDLAIQRQAVGESLPLMLNHLLATLFFRVDIVLLEAIKGDIVVGWYGVTYKWIDALVVIPSLFTQALFPVMSRQATEDRQALKRSYILAVKLLSLISLPVAVITTLLGTFLVGLLGGQQFLPHGAIALQLFVWSIPIGWINSVTNYVLIALNRQRVLTWAFVVGLLFNLVMNLHFIPIYSYPAASIITIFSELVLLMAFYAILRRALSPVPWFRVLWRIVFATLLMGGVTWALASKGTLLALVVGLAVYGVAVILLRPLTAGEMGQLLPLLPDRLRGRLAPRLAVE